MPDEKIAVLPSYQCEHTWKFGLMNLPQLADKFTFIPAFTASKLTKWVRLYDDDEVDTDRFIYTSQKGMDSVDKFLNTSQDRYYNWVYLWLKESFDPQSVTGRDFSNPDLLVQKPSAEAVMENIRLCDELFRRQSQLQSIFGNFQNMWIWYEISNLSDHILQMLACPEIFPQGKQERREESAKFSDYYDKVRDGKLSSPLRKVTEKSLGQLEKQTYEICETYRALIFPCRCINSFAVNTAKECAPFESRFFNSWRDAHKALNNHSRGNWTTHTFIDSIGILRTPKRGRPRKA
jgi:hypothetical protein